MQRNRYDLLLILFPIMSFFAISNPIITFIQFIIVNSYIMYLSDEASSIENPLDKFGYILRSIWSGGTAVFSVIFYIFPEGFVNLWNFSFFQSTLISGGLSLILIGHIILYFILRYYLNIFNKKSELLLFALILLFDSLFTQNLVPNNIGYMLLTITESDQIWRLLSISGISLLSAIVYFIILAVYQILFRKNYRYIPLASFISILLIITIGINEYYYSTIKEGYGDKIKIGVIQPNFATEEILSNKEKLVFPLKQMYEDSLKNKIDLLILPETIYPYVYNDESSYKEKYYRNIFSELYSNNSIIFGGFIKEGDSFINSVIIKNNKSKFQYIPKAKLLPFGEYIPNLDRFPFLKNIFTEYIPYSVNNLKNKHDYNSKTFYINKKQLTVNSAICYEILFPSLVKKKLKDTQLLINLGQGSWFGNSIFGVSGAAFWSYIHLRARAIEYGLPIVRSANTSGSYYISPKGRVISKIPILTKSSFIINEPLYSINTPYKQFGDWFKYTLSLLFIIIFFIRKFLKN